MTGRRGNPPTQRIQKMLAVVNMEILIDVTLVVLNLAIIYLLLRKK